MGNIDMKALFSLTYGMYDVSTDLEGRLNGQIANTVMQITLSRSASPPVSTRPTLRRIWSRRADVFPSRSSNRMCR